MTMTIVVRRPRNPRSVTRNVCALTKDCARGNLVVACRTSPNADAFGNKKIVLLSGLFAPRLPNDDGDWCRRVRPDRNDLGLIEDVQLHGVAPGHVFAPPAFPRETAAVAIPGLVSTLRD